MLIESTQEWQKSWTVKDGNLIIHLDSPTDTIRLEIPLEELAVEMSQVVAARRKQTEQMRGNQ